MKFKINEKLGLIKIKGDTALHEAAANGHEEIVNFLLDKGSNIEAKTVKGWTPLHAATFQGKINTASLLTKRGANIHAKDVDGYTPVDGQEILATFI